MEALEVDIVWNKSEALWVAFLNTHSEVSKTLVSNFLIDYLVFKGFQIDKSEV